ncbi:Rv3235 family protein [Kitasatospora sp. NPDC092286]|uniref:Rv3235 family protein n=1 Tax=Kitasatospora sp. NPDC092286 TaxID=3364087 RepID=UPI003815B4EF
MIHRTTPATPVPPTALPAPEAPATTTAATTGTTTTTGTATAPRTGLQAPPHHHLRSTGRSACAARTGHHPPADRRPRHPRAACSAAPGHDPRAALTTRFAHQLVEVLTGARPSGQLLRHTTLDGYGQLAALVRTGALRRGGATGRPRLGPVHDRSPSPDAVEACVRVDLGNRHHMVAFRLEQRGPAGQWQCTAVETR